MANAPIRPHSRASRRLALTFSLAAAACGDDIPDAAGGEGLATGAVASTGGESTGGIPEPDASTSGVTSTDGESSGDGDGTTGAEVDYEWSLPEGFPPPYVPEDNPMTAAKVELGRHLFYDERLSGNGTQSCGSCHEQALAFADGKAVPTGSTGDLLVRNSMALSNAGYSYPLTWSNNLLPTLEQQILVPIFGEFPTELGATGFEDEILQRLRGDEIYQQLFAEAYPELDEPFTFERIRQSLASFVRTMVSGNSPFDRYTYQGDLDALDDAQLRGLDLFFSEALECHHCHFGFNFSGATKHANTSYEPFAYHNTGLYNLDGEGAYPLGNQGLIETSFDASDMGKFRAVTLRNIEVTAPYLHDGSAETLEEVIRFYERGGRLIEEGPLAGDGATNPYRSGFVSGFTLTDEERADLIAFLESLTDEQFLTDPAFANPWE